MRPIDRNSQLDSSSGVVAPDLSPEPSPTASTAKPAIDQPVLPPDPATIAGKKFERDLETAFYKGTLDKAGLGPNAPVLYDKSAKPDGSSGTEIAGNVHEAAPVRVADIGDSDLNMDVRAAAGHLVGKKVVGTGECYDLADEVLRGSGAKSAPDFGKVTKSREQDYKWGTKIDLKDAKPGDVLQFRNHQVTVDVVKKTTRTYPDGHSTTSIDKSSTPYKRGQHTSIVLSNDGNGQMTVAEQHVIDHDTDKLSTTVRKNNLYTQDVPETKRTKTRMEGNVTIKEETTTTIKVTGQVWAYRPQPKENKK
jgi:cell wall-associated NlpC family hydrolase